MADPYGLELPQPDVFRSLFEHDGNLHAKFYVIDRTPDFDVGDEGDEGNGVRVE